MNYRKFNFFKNTNFLIFIFSKGGNYVLTLMDVYGGGIAVLVIAIAECIFISWVYGKCMLVYISSFIIFEILQ